MATQSTFRHVARYFHGLSITQFPKQIGVHSCINNRLPYASLTLISRNKSTYVPEPPVPPQIVESVPEISHALNALGEPTLSSLGLASWYPSGLVQYGLESLHVGLNVPWWGAIVIGTVILRVATFPLTVMNQRRSALLHNNSPQMNKLQAKVDRAKRSNNSLEVAKASANLYLFMKEKKFNPIMNVILPMAQFPVFLSVFVGIRQMTNLPVESMTNGGMLWFTDLTTSDPTFILPVATMLTLLATVEVGIDTVKVSSVSPKARLLMRAMPICVLPFTVNFPSSILMYWFASNGVSLFQAMFLRIHYIRRLLKIPDLVHTTSRPSENTSFVESFKSTWKKSKTTVDVESRIRAEAVKFKEAGMGAIPKTYSYNPTKKP